MSKTIDEKVVEMRFDNRHFEQHTRETMSTLDKLKQKLNLTGASKGLENINTSANKVNMSGMSNAIQSVSSKFSALEVMGITALANITNSAVNAGKRIVESLTIAPVTDGWREYEMTLNAVQTTMAGTGKTAEQVEEELKKLDIYADKTVYSTADMLNNLPKFTNAGVELEKATTAMIGIANATALAGGDANKASIAFYNLGQAIGTGYLTRMDYNSINNAGIATMEWKNQMVDAAIAAGTLKKAGDDLYSVGGKTMTLQQLFIDGLQYQWATTDVMMKVFQDYGDETTEIGKKSYAAAQDIKTFSMMMDSLKATAGTGWKDTWQIIFGGLDEAKEFWTGLSNFISNIITSMADFRNNLLEGALGRGLKKFKNTFSTITKPIQKTVSTVKDATTAVKDLSEVVNNVIRGNFGNGKARVEALTKAGYNYYAVQNKVNETLGCAFRYSDELVKSQEKGVETQTKLADSEAERLEQLAKMSEAELKALGFTKEQIEALKELKKFSEMTGLSISELIANIDEIDGRWLLINSFKNAGQGLVAVFKAMKNAWVEIFPPMTSDQLFGIIAALHKFSTHLVVSEETADKLRRTLKGLFAILDTVLTIVGGPIKIAVKIILQFLKALDIIPHDILGMTASIGDAIVAFHDWLDSVLDFTGIFKALAPYIKEGAAAVRDWFKGLGQSEAIKKFTEYLKNAKDAIVDWFKGLKETDNIAKYIFEGLLNGLANGAKGVIEFVINLGKQILDGIRKVLGIHSPSTEFYEIGQNIIQGLFNGISSLIQMVYNLVTTVGSKIIEIIKNLDIGSIFTIALGSGMAFAFIKIAKILDSLTSPLDGLGNLLYEAGETLQVFQKTLKSFSLGIKAEAIKTIAIAIAILAGSVAVLALLDVGKVWSSVGAIVVLMGALAGLTAIIGKFGGDNPLEFGKIALTIVALGVAMALMAKALKTISGIDTNKCAQVILGFVAIMGSLIILMATIGKSDKSFYKMGSTFIGIAAAVLLMAGVVKILGKMDQKELIQGGIAIVAFTGIIVGLMAATKLLTGSKNIDNIGKSILKIAGAILMMIIVAKIAGKMDENELKQGIQAIIAFSGIIIGLMAATKLITGSKNIDKIGGTILGIAGAMLLMTVTAKIIAGMEWDGMAKAAVGLAALGALIVGLIAATRLVSGKDLAKLGLTMMGISASIALLGLTAALLSLMSWEGLKKGITAVGFLSVFMMGLIAVTKMVPNNIMGTIITLTVAIGILAISIAGLSMIDDSNLKKAIVALGSVMIVFALVIASTKLAQNAMGTLIVMTIAIGVLAGVIYLIAQLPIEQALGASAALSILLLTMAGSLLLVSLMGPTAMMGVGALALVALIVAGLAVILAAMNNMNIDTAMGCAKSLSLLLIAMSAALVILGVVGMMGPAAFIGIAALATLIVGLTAVVVGIGALMQNPDVQNFLNTGISTLIQLASGIGEAIGAFVKGALTQISKGLPEIGTNLSLFMTNLTPFIAGAKMIDWSVLAGIGIITASIIALTAAELINGVVSFLSGGSSFAQLGSQLSMFMINAMPFITLSRQIDPAIMTGVKSLAEAVLILTGANVLEGLTSWLTGGNSLANFGAQLGDLGTSLNQFVTNLGTFTDEQVTTINCAGRAIKALADAAATIPNEGGLWGAICGENSLAKFGSELPVLATNLRSFVSNLGTFTDEQVTTIDCAGRAIKALAEAAKEIPNEGGLWGAICGENSLATFGGVLPELATNLNGFITNLGTFDDSKINTVNCAGQAIKTLAEAASSIPNEGGLWAKIAGDNSLATFAGNLPGLGTNLKEFVGNLGEFSNTQILTVLSACKAITSIAELGNIDIKDTGSKLEKFGSNMVKFAKKLKEFAEKVSEVGGDSITSSISKTKELIAMATDVANTNVDSLKTFGDSLKDFAKKGVEGFVKEFSGESPKSKAKKAVGDMVDSGIKGAENKKSDVKKKFSEIAKAAVDALCTDSLKDDAKQAGKDLVTGFANGIKNNKSLASDAGSSIGKAALRAAKDAIDSNSPSKEAMYLGNFFGEGFVIGIKDYASEVYNTSYSVADQAKMGLSKAISKVSELMNSDMDTTPTIRPVLDLSEVESGVGAIGSMFNGGPSIGVMSNLRAISSGMNAKGQNGTNSDVISAINKLGKSLGNTGGDTYNINGITYDDGSNITDAVKTLVRAAKMERRV